MFTGCSHVFFPELRFQSLEAWSFGEPRKPQSRLPGEIGGPFLCEEALGPVPGPIKVLGAHEGLF